MVGFFAFFNLGKTTLYNWDEGIYANLTAEMGKIPSFSLSHGGEPWLQKPVFGIWLHSVGVDLFGLNNFGLRAMSAFSFVMSAFVLYLLLRKFYSNILAFIITMSFGVCPLLFFPHIIRTADLDTYFLFFSIASIYLYVLSWSRPRLFWLAGVFVGLAFMARGYIAILIFFVIFFHWFWLKRQGKTQNLKLAYMAGAFLLIVLPWHIYSYLAHPLVFINSYIDYSFWQRLVTPLEGHAGGPWFYTDFALYELSIFFLVFLAAIIYVPIEMARSFKDEDCLWLLWFWIFFLTLQLMDTKIIWYLMGVAPALFCLVAAAFDHWLKNTSHKTVLIVSAAILGLAYFTCFFINAFYYVWRPVILPIDMLDNYLSEKSVKPDIIFVYSKLDELKGPAADFQWNKLHHDNVVWVDKISDIQLGLSGQKKCLIVTDNVSEPEISSYFVKRFTSAPVILGFDQTAWGDFGNVIVLDQK